MSPSQILAAIAFVSAAALYAIVQTENAWSLAFLLIVAGCVVA